MGCHFLLQGLFLNQGSKLWPLHLLYCQADSLPLCHLGSPEPNLYIIYIYNKMYYTYNKNCYIKNKIYYKVLAHAMKVGVFCDLQSANWRPRKAGVTVQSPESQGVSGVDPSQSRKVWEPGPLRAEGNQCSNSTIRWRVNVTFFHLFILSRPSMNWMMPTRVGKDQLLFSICQFKCSSLPETPSQTCPYITFHQLSGRSTAQSSWHVKYTIAQNE